MPTPRRPQKASPARRAAYEILKRVTFEQAFAANLLASSLTAKLSAEDRALTYEIVLGVLRHQRRIDYFLEQLSERNLARLDNEVLIALRIGFYQIQYLTRLPAHAIVNESVNLVRMSGKGSAAGFVNALLRKAAQLPQIEDPIALADPVESASLEQSHPAWMFERWAARYGIEWASALAKANNSPAPLSFRLNSLAGTDDEILRAIRQVGLEVAPSSLVTGAFRLTTGNSGALLELAARGLIHIQDEGSQLVASLVNARPGSFVLDACAAPGGKTTALAAQMGNRGLIVAGDLHPSRLRLVQENSHRLGITIIAPVCYDATIGLPFLPARPYDYVLVDAPCTGTGTLRRNPEIKWRLSPEKIAEMAILQEKILQNVAPVVAPGGRLVYSTCSIEEEENEAVICKFLDTHPEFCISLPEVPERLRTAGGFVRSWPHRDGSDGFFAAVLVKERLESEESR